MDQGFRVLELPFDPTGQHIVDFVYRQLLPAFSQQSGIPEGAQGRTARELMPDLEPCWFKTYGHVALTGNTVRLEHYVPQVSRWFDVPTFRKGTPTARQVGVPFHDIPTRKRCEANLAFLADINQVLVGLRALITR